MMMDFLPKTEEEKDVTIGLFGTRYFCLKNPKFYPGGQLMNGIGTYWLGKLDSVDGLFVGRWSEQPDGVE
jgi:hypothetical protein